MLPNRGQFCLSPPENEWQYLEMYDSHTWRTVLHLMGRSQGTISILWWVCRPLKEKHLAYNADSCEAERPYLRNRLGVTIRSSWQVAYLNFERFCLGPALILIRFIRWFIQTTGSWKSGSFWLSGGMLQWNEHYIKYKMLVLGAGEIA